jgi:nucleoside-diphosphate-sugar epimerase
MIKRKLLILGGSGFLGHNIARRFEADGKYFITIGDLTESSFPGSIFIKLDILNKSLLDTIIQDHDIIINCTGQIANPINKCLVVNTEGIENISESVRRHEKKLFHISTSSVYGTCENADEQNELNPESPYSTCKVFAEFQVMKIQNTKPCILRLPNLYGENQTKGLFSYLIKSFSTDKKLQFNNDGSLRRNFLHIADCAEAVFLAVEKELSGIFNVTAPDNYNLKEIVEMIERMKSVKFETVYEQHLPIENITGISFKAFTEQTGFIPQQSIRTFINNSFFLK